MQFNIVSFKQQQKKIITIKKMFEIKFKKNKKILKLNFQVGELIVKVVLGRLD